MVAISRCSGIVSGQIAAVYKADEVMRKSENGYGNLEVASSRDKEPEEPHVLLNYIEQSVKWMKPSIADVYG